MRICGHRIDQIDELVTGLPLEAEIVARDGVEHQLPGVRVVGDVPVAARPVSVHRAILEREAHPLVCGAARKLAPDRLELGQARLDRLAAHAAGEARDRPGAEMVRVVDQRFPTGKRLPVEIAVLERVAEHAERVDGHVGVADRLANLLRQQRQVLVHGLPEEGLDALEPESDDLPHIGGGIRRVSPNHGADANIEQRSL